MENQEEKLRQEIWKDVSSRAEKILERARNDASALLLQARRDSEERRKRRLEETRAALESIALSRTQEVEHQIAAEWLGRREEVLTELLEEALRAAESLTGEAHASSYRHLAEEALAAMGEQEREILVSFPEADGGLVTECWLRECWMRCFPGAADCRFVLSPEKNGRSGLKFSTPGNRMVYDNTYAARLQRGHDELRALVCEETPGKM